MAVVEKSKNAVLVKEYKKISIYEYNEEEHMRMERRDAYEEGLHLALKYQ